MTCQDHRVRARKRQEWLVIRPFCLQDLYWNYTVWCFRSHPSPFPSPWRGPCCSSQADLFSLPLNKPVSPSLQRPFRISLGAFPACLPQESCPHGIVPTPYFPVHAVTRLREPPLSHLCVRHVRHVLSAHLLFFWHSFNNYWAPAGCQAPH